MFPGTTTKLSEKNIPFAATIDADADVLFITGNGALVNIRPRTGGFGQFLVLVPVASTITVSAAGNIGLNGAVQNLANNQANCFYYSKLHGKWVHEYY